MEDQREFESVAWKMILFIPRLVSILEDPQKSVYIITGAFDVYFYDNYVCGGVVP